MGTSCKCEGDWWGYNEDEQPVELNAYVAAGNWGYDEDWNIVNPDTINLLRSSKGGKGCKSGKGKPACFNCGKVGHLKRDCLFPPRGSQTKASAKAKGGWVKGKGKTKGGGKGKTGGKGDNKGKGVALSLIHI